MKKSEGLYLVEYEVDWNTKRPMLWLFSRLKNGQKQIEKIKDFKPYFYIDYDCPYEGSGEYNSIYGQKVKKVIVNSPREIYDLRNHINELGYDHYEADILYNNRYLIDEVEEIIKTNYKIFHIDIETLSEGGFPDVNTTQQPIVCLTIYDNFKNKYVSWIWRKDFNRENVEGVNDNNIIRKFSNEKDMLQDVINYINIEQPDIMTGWNCVDENTDICLNNKIKKIKDVNIGDKTNLYGKILNKIYTGEKKVYQMTDCFGNKINITNNHIIPAVYKEKNKYKHYENLNVNVKDLRFNQIKELYKKNKDIFLKLELKENKNKKFKNINEDLLWLLGIIYTDGTWDQYSNRISICNSNKNIIDKVNKIILKYNFKESGKKFNYKRRWDKCFYYNIFLRKDDKLKKLLQEFIYNVQIKKDLNMEKLSSLSYNQFSSFFAGLIDGDGSISSNKQISFAQKEMEEREKIQKLLFFNNVISTCHLNILISSMEYNQKFIQNFSKYLYHDKKKKRIKKMKFFEYKDTRRKLIKYMIKDNNVLIRIKDIKEIGMKKCYDITTEKHYFCANNIKVHNCLHFDFKYLLNRMKNIFNLNIRKLSPMNVAYVQKDRDGMKEGYSFKGIPIIKGMVLFDLLNYYRKVHKGELSSYSLNNVAESELGEQKTDSHHVVDKDWLNDWMNIIKYNVKDVELTVKIDEKQGVIDFFDQMRTISHVNLDDCKFYGRVVDMFILRYAKQKNIVLPSKKEYDPNRKLEGGYVQDPLTGLHKNVIVIDLNSIYPNLINTFNLSPECRDENGSIEINQIKFQGDKQGIIPSVLDELQRLRGMFKGRMKELRYEDPDFKLFDMKQQAAKNLACTVYGVQALSTFRLNTDYVAQTITYLGRELILWMKDEIEKKGYEVVYIDTDSNFIKMGDDLTKEECIQKGKELAQYINDHINEFTSKYGVIGKHSLGVDFEKLYAKLLLVAKKRYAGHVIWKDGKDDDALQLIGLDAKRSDTSQISKDMQKKVLNMILKGDDKNQIFNYLSDLIQNIKKLDYDKMAIPVKFEKEPEEYPTNIPRVRGAKWAMKNLNVRYGAGDKVLMLYVYGETDAICFEDNKQLTSLNIQIDYPKMIDKLVFMKTQRIFEAMGWENEIIKLNAQYIKNNKLLTEYF